MKYRFAFSLIFLFMMMSCGTSKKTKSASAENSKTQQSTSNTEASTPVRRTDIEDSVREEEETLNLNILNPVERYIYDYAGIAQEEMKLYGIPASITIAQGILESGSRR